MVKNIHGGNRHKGFARKHTIAKPDNKLRIAGDECELYAVVTKMLGNNMFHCVTIDGITRLCHIRGRFAGRGKRDNMINVDTWILIGVREWESNNNAEHKRNGKIKLPNCDLLEVYSDLDKERLKNSVSENWLILSSNETSKHIRDDKGEDSIHFMTEQEEEVEKFVADMRLSQTKKITLVSRDNEEKEVTNNRNLTITTTNNNLIVYDNDVINVDDI
jgi:translation initiation factor IF-1